MNWKRWKLGLAISGAIGFFTACAAAAVLDVKVDLKFALFFLGLMGKDVVLYLKDHPAQQVRFDDDPQQSMKKIIPLIGIAALLAMTTVGCALFNQNSTDAQKAADVQRLSYAAASIGTQAALIENPAYRPAFSLAYSNLNTIVEGKVITGTLLRSVLADLPVKELKSPQAKLAIDSATMLYDAYAGTTVNIETNLYVRAAATGIRDGLKTGLGY